MINEAYAGYFVPLHVTEDQIARMDQTYDVDLECSVLALVDTEPVGMALLGRRGARGWLHSVGTLPPWRRLGIGRAMVAQVIAGAAGAGVEELALEVIVQNLPAYRLYESLGFRPRRELLTWQRSATHDPLPIPRERLVPAQPSALYDMIASWQAGNASTDGDERPCWQREVASLRKMEGALRGYELPLGGAAAGPWLVATRHGQDPGPGGCCLVTEMEQTVSIMAAALRTGDDRVGLGRILLQALAARYMGRALSMLNVPADAFMCHVLGALRFTVTMRQVEMVRYLC
jgi:GNAT superfamily N-acetyltransferase